MYNIVLIATLTIVSIIFLFIYKPTQKTEGLKTNNKKYLDGIDVIYWINLDRSIDRRANMESMFRDPVFAGIPIIRINAVDGKASNIDEILNTKLEGMKSDKFTKVEYACTLSHLETIKTFLNTNYKNALIMEDDMTLELKPYWKKSVKQIIQNAPSDWEVIQLTYTILNVKPKLLYTKNDGILFSAGAYIINRRGATKILNYSNKHKLNEKIDHGADSYLINSTLTYTYKYPMFIYAFNENSTIHQDHISTHDKSKKTILNKIYGIID
jgi:GR25 family glycosyltransferase involved in LPS biosynthesis